MSVRPAQPPNDDFGARILGDNPRRVYRILGLHRAGHSYTHIVGIGEYQGTWTEQHVRQVLTDHGIPVPQRVADARPLVITARQAAVLRYMCQGMTNSEIADAAHLSHATVAYEVKNLLARSASRDRIALIVAVLTGRQRPIQHDDTRAV